MSKKQEDALANAIVYRTVGNLKTAEDVANAVMSQGKFRNILRNRNGVRNYMAAAVYLLATHLPVEVQPEQDAEFHASPDNEYPPVRYRSRVGDVAHLLVLLTYLPSQIFSLFEDKPEIQEYLSSDFELFRSGRNEELNGRYEQLSETVRKIISEKKWVQYIHDEYVFRPPHSTVSQIMDPVPASAFTYKGLSTNKIYNRFVTDINRLIFEKQGQVGFTLEELGRRLKFLRLNSDLTQTQLADRIGVSHVAVSRVESGECNTYSAETLFLYIRYFSAIINLDILFDERMWRLAMQDREMLLKRICTNSIVNRKLELLKQNMNKQLEVAQQNLMVEMDGIRNHLDMGMDSILAFTEENDEEDIEDSCSFNIDQ